MKQVIKLEVKVVSSSFVVVCDHCCGGVGCHAVGYAAVAGCANWIRSELYLTRSQLNSSDSLVTRVRY